MIVDGIINNEIVFNSFAKYIDRNLNVDTEISDKRKKYINILLYGSCANYIDLEEFRTEFRLPVANYKELLNFFLNNYEEIYKYGNKKYIKSITKKVR